ncbi:hypothetical protein ASZ90_016321 [hydrocarbon metagenome]|uniref:Uncharacterized protein n=1 Tax=hydrocarbon metagenome TaxID=938273 RepID=A0A0W8EZZ3_9ZZZZ
MSGDSYSSGFVGMLVLPVTSFGFHEYPAIRFNHMDDIYGLSGTITR